MNVIKSIFKVVSFIMGVCTYGTVCFGCLVLYGILKTKVFEIYPNIKYPELINVMIFIGCIGLISILYKKIHDNFVEEPTIKVKITKTKTEKI